MAAPKPGDSSVLLVGALGELLQLLRTEGYQLAGPTVRGGAIVHAEILGIGMVVLKTGMGSRRLLDLLSGEQLPRIC